MGITEVNFGTSGSLTSLTEWTQDNFSFTNTDFTADAGAWAFEIGVKVDPANLYFSGFEIDTIGHYVPEPVRGLERTESSIIESQNSYKYLFTKILCIHTFYLQDNLH